MNRIVIILLLQLLILPKSPAAIVTQWDFNNGSTTPSTGSGTMSALNTTGSIGSGYDSSTVRSSDSIAAPSANNLAYTLSAFPTSTNGNDSAGAEFFVSTLGYDNIVVQWDHRHSDTSSRYVRFEYTLDGAAWINANVFAAEQTSVSWYNGRNVDFSSVPGVANNPAFGFRFVSEFENSATGAGTPAYVPSRSTSTYGPAGTWRVDMVTVSGDVTPVPEPSTTTLIILGALAFGVLTTRRFSDRS